MLPSLVLVLALLAAPPHRATGYDATFVLDTLGHVLGDVEMSWVLGSGEPVQLAVDPGLRIVRVLVDGRRERFAPGEGTVVIPHARAAGDPLTTRVRYHGQPRTGAVWLLPDARDDSVTVRVRVEVPPGFRGLAPGVLATVDTLPRGRLVWHYQLAGRVPLRDVAAFLPPRLERLAR